MASRHYQNFDLLLDQAGDGHYEARVTAAPITELPHVRFRLPFDEKSLKILMLELDPGRTDVRSGGGDVQRRAAKEFGGPLFEAIFTGKLAAAWTRSLDKISSGKDGGLRLRLRVADEASALADLPWELLYDAAGGAFPAQSEITPLVRFLDVASEHDPIEVDGPLRVLAVISSPLDLPELDVEREWARIETAMAAKVREGLVVVDRLPEATVEELGEWLLDHDVHVIHFIGHGDFDPTSGEGFIFFQNDRGGADRVPADVLGPFIHDHDPLRMVVLNACRGARVSPKDPYGGMAQGLVQRGAAAVVAMQFPITDAAAVMFTGKFYGALAAGRPVEQAVSYARKALQAKFHSEWATPVLFMRSRDGDIFRDVHAPPGWVQHEQRAPEPTVPDEIDPALTDLDPTDLDVEDIAAPGVTDSPPHRRQQGTRPAVPDPYEFLFVAKGPEVEPPDPEPPDPEPPDPEPPDPEPPDPEPPAQGWLRAHVRTLAVTVVLLLVAIAAPVVAMRVFGGDGAESGPHLSDSEMLVAAGTDFDHLNIYRVDEKSGTSTQLTFDAKSWLPVLSPDRRTMVYLTRNEDSEDFQLYTGSAVEPEDGQRPFLDDDLTCDDVSRPAWNPKTGNLVFRCEEGTKVTLVQVDEDGGNHRVLLTLGVDEAKEITWIGDPTISADGSRVVFFGNNDPVIPGREPRRDGVLHSYTFATGDVALLHGQRGVKGYYSDPVFSPDGQWLAWREDLTQGQRPLDFEVYAAQLGTDGTIGRTIAVSDDPQAVDQDPSFSNDNQHIAYATRPTGSETEQTIVVVPIHAPEERHRLASDLPGFQSVPAWGTGR